MRIIFGIIKVSTRATVLKLWRFLGSREALQVFVSNLEVHHTFQSPSCNLQYSCITIKYGLGAY